MLAKLIEIAAWDPVAGEAVAIRAVSVDDARVTALNNVTWWPVIVRSPKLSLDLFDGAFQGEIASGASGLRINLAPFPNAARYQLADARLRIWTGAIGDSWGSYTLRFDGRVKNQPNIDGGEIEISARVDDKWMDGPLLGTYAGTGGTEGPAAWKGRAKPLALGAPKYVAADMVDPVNNVVQLSAYGAINNVTAALDRLNRYGAALTDTVSYAALIATVIPAGRWAICKAEGLARYGAPPGGLGSFMMEGDAAGPDGWARKPGQLIRRLALIAGATGGQIDNASLAALDAARPYNLSVYQADQIAPRELIQSIAASVNASAGVSWLGKLFACPVAIGPTAIVTLRSDGSTLPMIEAPQQLESGAPFWRWATEGDRTWTVHSGSDIAYAEQPAAVYRQPSPPASAVEGAEWIDTDNNNLRAIHNGLGLFIGSTEITIGGVAIDLPWVEVTDGRVATAAAEALAAQEAADAAQADAEAATVMLDAIVDDNVLDRSEKVALIAEWADLTGEQAGIDASATTYGATSEKTAYDAAISAAAAHLASLSPAWSDTGSDTPIDRVVFSGKLRDIYSSRQAVLDKIDLIAGQRALWAGVSGSGRPQDNATVGAPSGTNVGSTPATTVEAGANAANAGLNGDGTVKATRVGTLSMQAGSVSTPLIMSGGLAPTLINTFTTIASGALTMADAGVIYVSSTLGLVFVAGGNTWEARILVNGVAIASLGGAATQVGVPLVGAAHVGAGTHTITVQGRAPPSSNIQCATDMTTAQGMMR